MAFSKTSVAAFLALTVAGACTSPQPEAPPPLAGDWTLDASQSRLSFVSIKAGEIVEAHTFKSLAGSVAADGAVAVEVDLASVDTGIELRDQRMREIFFQTDSFPEATVSASLDPAAFAALDVGDSIVLPVTATLTLHGVDSEVDADLSVTRIAADKVLVATIKPVILSVDDFDLGAGLEQLRELANLPAITSGVPVSFTFVFTH